MVDDRVVLNTNNLPDYFAIADKTNSHYTIPTNCFDFLSRQNNKLLVTIGDSWTYGQNLTDRLNNVFGNLVSKKFDFDWLNLGQPGASNFFIAEKTEELAKISGSMFYKEIIVICTFTEVGRGFNSHHDQNLDYISWLDNTINSSQDFNKFLFMLNQHCVDRILKSARNRFKVFFASNFISHLALPPGLTIDPVWIELLRPGHLGPMSYAGSTGLHRLLDIEQFISDKHKLFFKDWISNSVDLAKHVDENLRNMHTNSLHPNIMGHRIWANQVIEWLSCKNHV